jgi:Tfp pilus assembly protein PilF
MSAEGRTRAAVRRYQEALKVHPDYAEAHNNLGAALATEGRYEEAAFHFSEAVRLKPGYRDARRNLQLAAKEMRRPEPAGGSGEGGVTEK